MRLKKSILLGLVSSFLFSCSTKKIIDLDIGQKNNLIFKLKKNISLKDFEKMKVKFNINNIDIISKQLKIIEINKISNEKLIKTKEYLNKNKFIEYSYSNNSFKSTLTIKSISSDFKRNNFLLNNFDPEWNYKSINLQEDNINKSDFSNKVTIAVLDTGIDSSNLTLNKNSLPLLDLWNQERGDDSSYINDKKISYKNKDGNGHGTFISGIINEIIDKTTINNKIKILPIKIANLKGESSPNLIAKGIFLAIKNNAKVINISLGGDPKYNESKYLEDAIKLANKKNIILVSAAGNEANRLLKKKSHLNTPANFFGVISVGAIDRFDRITNYSNSGKNIDIVAPGGSEIHQNDIEEKIFSTWPTYKTYRSQNKNFYGSYTNLIGTSVSTAHVSAVSALILSKNISLTANQVRLKILATAKDINFPGFDENSGYGKLNAFDAIYSDSKI